jgi:hypothetical protein
LIKISGVHHFAKTSIELSSILTNLKTVNEGGLFLTRISASYNEFELKVWFLAKDYHSTIGNSLNIQNHHESKSPISTALAAKTAQTAQTEN